MQPGVHATGWRVSSMLLPLLTWLVHLTSRTSVDSVDNVAVDSRPPDGLAGAALGTVDALVRAMQSHKCV